MTYAYDIAGNVAGLTDGNGHKYTLSYNDSYLGGSQNTYAHVSSITNPLGQTAAWQYDYPSGNVTMLTDVNGVSTKYSYNDPLDRVTLIDKASGVAGVEADTTVTYNVGTTQIDVKSNQVSLNDGGILHKQTLYDGFGRDSVDNTFEPSTATVIGATKTYDALGRPLSATTPDGAVTCYSYSNNVNTSCSLPSGSTTGGDWTLVQDASGKQRQMFSDGLGRLTQVVEDPGSSHLAYTTTYSYDALDDLLSVNQAGLQQRSFAYDGLKRLLASMNPENHSISVAAQLSCSGTATGSKWTHCYSYDNVGNLLNKMDNRNLSSGSAFTATNYTYDNLNRVLSKSYMLGVGVQATPKVAYCYDAPYTVAGGCPATGVAGYVGRLTAVVNSNSATIYNGFDALGRVLSSSQVTTVPVGGVGTTNAYNFQYSYNLAGSLVSETYPSGRLVNTCYDGTNRVTQVGLATCGSAGSVYAGNVTYAPHGAPWLTVLGNGVDHGANYNSRLQMCGIQDVLKGSSFAAAGCGTATVRGGSALLNVSLNWGGTGDNGNLVGSTYVHSGGTLGSAVTLSQTYGYDGVNRLTSVMDTGYWRGFGYDAFGNMYVQPGATGITPNGNTPQGSGLYANNQLTGGTYDAAGNETVVNGDSIVYDAESRQTGVYGTGLGSGVTYVYDGDGRRVGKSTPAGTTVFVYDAAGRMAAEYGTVVDTPDCVTCYLSGDQLGTARLITDQGGLVVSRHDYLPFGEEIAANTAGRSGVWGAGGDSINQKFTGKERDAESGLDYFGARYYGSGLGRFTSPDPIYFQKEMLVDPQRFNLYSYVQNSPLVLLDPTGETIQLTGESDEERKIQLAAIQAAVGSDAKVGIERDKNGNFNVTISGDTSKGSAKDFASIITNSEVAKFGVISRYEISPIDGKSMSQHGVVGETGRDPSGQLWVFVQSDAIPNADASLFDFRNSGAFTRALDSLFDVPADRGIETGHEFGHALYKMRIGRSGQYSRDQDNRAAMDLENKVRQGRDPSAPIRKTHE